MMSGTRPTLPLPCCLIEYHGRSNGDIERLHGSVKRNLGHNITGLSHQTVQSAAFPTQHQRTATGVVEFKIGLRRHSFKPIHPKMMLF
jgi:hypothetical protein